MFLVKGQSIVKRTSLTNICFFKESLCPTSEKSLVPRSLFWKCSCLDGRNQLIHL